MDKLLLCLLVIVNFPGAFFQGNTSGKAFVFPTESDNSYVTLSAPVQKPLKAFTLCLQVYTALTRSYSLFSFATKAQYNEILLFSEKPGLYSVSVGGSDAYFKVPEAFYTPRHFCVTWESQTGITELWVDGKPMVRMSLKKGYTVGSEASIILGQEQDSFGGGFNKNQALVGDIGDVNMWDFVLPPEEIRAVSTNGVSTPNVLNWEELKYETRGEVFLKDQLWV
ncbi:C-reactive protein [Meles meles]|uniref:C-reactive protein n=1 Tax=Meles meles TaxID=9662 RepID=UPI001E69B330|nr:C-reactive protein [Meles meles]